MRRFVPQALHRCMKDIRGVVQNWIETKTESLANEDGIRPPPCGNMSNKYDALSGQTAERNGCDKSTVSREPGHGSFASNENGSYLPYRPKTAEDRRVRLDAIVKEIQWKPP